MNYKRVFIPNSCVFIIIVTYHRKPILLHHIDILRKAFRMAHAKYPFELVAFIINPDHLHMLIKPQNIDTYPKIVGLIKATFTKSVHIKYSLNLNKESTIWQRRYWEHVIRNEKDFQKHLDYIHYNSVKHSNIAPEHWPHSSFRKFVKRGFYELTWCNIEDKNNITKLNLE